MATLTQSGSGSNFVGSPGSPVEEVFQGETNVRPVTIKNESDNSAVELLDDVNTPNPVTISHRVWDASIAVSGTSLTFQSLTLRQTQPTVDIAISDVVKANGTFTITETDVLASETIDPNSNTDVPTIEVFVTMKTAGGETKKWRYVLIVRRAL